MDAPRPVFLSLVGQAMSHPLLPPTPIPITPHPGLTLAEFDTRNFAGPFVCDQCHGDLRDASGQEVTASRQWRATMMANSARDPFWQAKVSSEIARRPAERQEIEALCSRCHMPMAYTQAIAAGDAPAIFTDGFLDQAHPLHQAAMDGVSCTLCHQIQPDNLGDEASFKGRFRVDVQAVAPDRVLFGPYPNPDSFGSSIMRSGSGFTPRQGLHLSSAGLCGSCHTLFTPFTDEHGAAGEFPEQTPYLEWLHSDYPQQGLTCQGCHMPAAEGAVAIFPGWPEYDPYRQHIFVGGNVFMLRLLQSRAEELGLRASTAGFEAAIQHTLAQLQERTATVTLQSSRLEDGELAAEIRIDNLAGHKFPSGYPSRRAWLHITVTDGDGALVFESGRPLSHGGILGDDAELQPGSFEPHHTVISHPDQVQIYETIMHDAAGQLTHTLLDAAGYLKDNRLLPAGFDKATAPAAVAVRGAASGDETFTGGQDLVHLRIPVAIQAGPYTLTVRLLYQTIAYPTLVDLRLDDTPEVERFLRYYAAADKTAVEVARAEVTLP